MAKNMSLKDGLIMLAIKTTRGGSKINIKKHKKAPDVIISVILLRKFLAEIMNNTADTTIAAIKAMLTPCISLIVVEEFLYTLIITVIKTTGLTSKIDWLIKILSGKSLCSSEVTSIFSST